LAKDINMRFEKNQEGRTSGLVINTCGWVDGVGYELLLYAIDALNADIVCVIDHERLFSDLTRNYGGKNVRVLKLQKSGGVVTRDPAYRKKSRINRIKDYFYGMNRDLYPHQTSVHFSEINIYKVGGGPQAPSSALPIGSVSTVDPVRLTEIFPSGDLLHALLGVSHAKTPETILTSNVAGFVIVTEVNFERQKIVLLAPCPGPLPSRYLLLGSIKYLE